MKKNIRIITLMCFLLSITNTSWGQVEYGKYRLKMFSGIMQNTGNHKCDIRMEVLITANGIETFWGAKYSGDIDDDKYFSAFPLITQDYPTTSNIRPTSLRFHTKRIWGGRCNQSGKGDKTYKLDLSKLYINQIFKNGDDVFGTVKADISIQFHPYEIKLWYFDDSGHNQGQLLPMNDKITLKATKGFVAETYKWQYCADGYTWKNFPSSFQNKDEITFSGTDIFTQEEYLSLIKTGGDNVQVRINAVTEIPVQTIILTPNIEAPHFVSDSHDLETCSGSGDATLYLTMDRALYTGEIIYIASDNQVSESNPTLTLDATHTGKLIGLPAKTHNLHIWGAVNRYRSFGTASNHYRVVEIKSRPAITHSLAATKNVSCIGGTDGTLSIAASGGTEQYRGNLMRDGSTDIIQQVDFTTGETGTFTRLKAGTYKITVFDDNGCSNNITQTVTVSEPSQPVDVLLERFVPPLAYDSSDGEATIRINGGTQAANGYTTKFRSESGQSYSPQTSSRDGESYLYTFKGLHRGTHYITVEDKNFPQLAPGDEQIPCGCTDTLSFYLPAPPPQTVKIEETHFINCYGSDEGQLTAHAQGGVQFSNGMPYRYTWYKQSDVGLQEQPQPNDSVINRLTVGTYQVKMTDYNGISMMSAPYILIQPDSLSVRFETSDIGCSGKLTGRVKAFVAGGTLPYRYQWNKEGETNDEISALEAGIYMFKVTDERNCQLIATTEIKAPGDLKVDTLITHPSCIAPEGGAIELKLTGATPPYKVVWADNKSTDLKRKGLSPGTYYVTVSDVNGCSSSYSFSLKKPREFSVKLSEGFTMCHGQSRPITVKCDEPEVTYEWYCNDTKLSDTDSTLVADKAGTYHVIATNPQGCTAEDEVTINVSRETLNLVFAVPTAIAVGSEIYAVNLSTVSADRIRWNLPEEAQVIKQSDTEAVFSIRKKGAYALSLEGFKGDCSTIVTRTIHVMDKDEVTLPADQPPLIKQFLVTPNPTTSYFKVMVELNSEEDFTMTLYSPDGVLMDTKKEVKVQNKIFEYEVNGTLQGTYLLHLQTKADKSVLQIVIKKD